MKERQGEREGGGGVAAMPFPNSQPVEQGTQGEGEQKEQREELHLLLPPLLFHVEVSVLSKEVSYLQAVLQCSAKSHTLSAVMQCDSSDAATVR